MLRCRAATTMPMAINMIASVVRFDESSPVSGSDRVTIVVGGLVVGGLVVVGLVVVGLVVVGLKVVVVVGAAGAVGVPVMAFDAVESPTAFTALMVIE